MSQGSMTAARKYTLSKLL